MMGTLTEQGHHNGGDGSCQVAAAALEEAYLSFRTHFINLMLVQGVDAYSGASVSSMLGINRQLAWRIASSVAERSCAKGLPTIPGTKGLEIILDACGERFGRSPEVDSLAQAVQTLEAAIRHHAGERSSLPYLAGIFGPHELETRTESLRGDTFQAQSTLLGLQAAMQVRGIVLAPSKTGDSNSLYRSNYAHFSDLMRLRADRPTTLIYAEAPRDDGPAIVPDEGMTRVMNDTYGFVESCSTADPSQISIRTEQTRGWVQFLPGATGRSAAETLSFASSPNSPFEESRFRSQDEPLHQAMNFTFVPSKVFCIDVLMHKSLPEARVLHRMVEASCFDASTGMPVIPASSSDPAFLFELEHFDELTGQDFELEPKYRHLYSLAKHAAACAGTELSELVGLRFKTKYALSPQVYAVTRRLPDVADI